MKNCLEVTHLNKKYPGSDFQLNDVTFSIPYGSIVGFIGENGAGKTTTMGTILGTLKKSSGHIEVFGEKMDDKQPSLKEDIGVVFDGINFSDSINITQLAQVMEHIYRQWSNEKFAYYSHLFSLPKRQKVQSFSRGMSMKLSLAVALSHDAKLLFLDEATAGLDPVAREELLDVLSEFVKDNRRSILLSSHITSDIEKIADHLIFIKRGQIILNVSAYDLFTKYALYRCHRNEFKKVTSDCLVAYQFKDDYVDVLVTDEYDLPTYGHKKDFSIDDMTTLLMRGEKI